MNGARSSTLSSLLAFRGWWPRVGIDSARGDLVAGLTGALVVLPQGVAFATIAGLPPQYGLYSAMVPTIIAALFGSSWHLVSGPTTAISIVVFASISPLAEPGSAEFISLTLTLTFMVGLIQLGMGIARLGTLVNFISHTVVIGFTAGAAILIASSQFKNFLGISIPRGASFYETIREVVARAGEIDPYVTSVGAITLLTGIVFKRFFPRIPYMIAAMLVGSVAGVLMTRLLGPVAHIRTVGALPATLPPLSHPSFSLDVLKRLGSDAFAVSMLALTEAVSIGRAIAVRSEQRIDGNQEFIGQGLSNLVGSFFSSYAASGSFNRSGLNYDAGARTPLAAVFASFFLAAILLLVAPLAAYLPIAAMAGILFLVAWGLIDFKHIRGIARTSRAETAILLTTFLSTLFLELEVAIYAGVILSLVLYLTRTSRPPVLALAPSRDHPNRRFAGSPGLPECSQLRILDVHGSLFFGAIDHVQQRLQEGDATRPGQNHVLIVADGINFADIAGAEMLAREARRRRKLGGGLYLVGLKPRTREVLRIGGHLGEIGEENVFEDEVSAVEEIRKRLDPHVCASCEKRVFEECGPAPRERKARVRAAGGIAAAFTAAAFAEEGDAATARQMISETGEVREGDPGERSEDDAPAPEASKGRRLGS